MRAIAADVVAWSVSLCLCVGHDREPHKNGWTDREAVQRGLLNHLLDGARVQRWKGHMYPTPLGQWTRPVFAAPGRNQQHAAEA